MEPVIGEFINYVEENKDTGGQPQAQSEYVDGCISPVSPEVSKCNQDITSDHGNFN
jgi:hypothetical protein